MKAGSPESIALAAATNGENASSGNTDAATDTTSEDGESDRKARTSASLGKAQEGSLVDRSPIRKAIRKELGEGSLRHGGLKFGDSIFDLVVAAEIAENRDKIEEQLANSDAESKFEEPLHPDGTVAKIGKRTRRHSIAY